VGTVESGMGNLPYEYNIRKIETATMPKIGPSHFCDVHPGTARRYEVQIS